MFRLISILLLAGAVAVSAETITTETPVQSPLDFMTRVKLLNSGDQISQACCKTCRKGKACGNSCINASKACHVGVGCACDG